MHYFVERLLKTLSTFTFEIQKDMSTFKQKVLRFLYPLIRKAGKAGKNGTVLHNDKKITASQSFHTQHTILSSGKTLHFADFSGKKILVVNTASDCGYTGQYAELQKLHEQLGDKLPIIAFPANDFLEQEKGSDADIAQFCQINYGVTFPIAKKSVVIKNEEQNPVFKWLTDAKQNGWNNHAPDWNFSKYIIDENGNLAHYFGPSVSPLDEEFIEAVK